MKWDEQRGGSTASTVNRPQQHVHYRSHADEAVTRSRRASFGHELVDEQIQLAANTANLPVSTIIRLWTLDRLHAERTGGTVTDRLARLEHAVFRRSAA
ncbi:MAG: hypothetical protein BGO26_09445 [Actinobacteria bacterium 69-20]|nr:MAG: hypothetical protein BGO26_09445 [Actinobacteria bacterium 69-20]